MHSRRLGRTASAIGEAGTYLAYAVGVAVSSLIRFGLFLLAGLAFALVASGTALLWVITAAGGVQVTPIVMRWPVPNAARPEDFPAAEKAEA
jgi:hypothetical protein